MSMTEDAVSSTTARAVDLFAFMPWQNEEVGELCGNKKHANKRARNVSVLLRWSQLAQDGGDDRSRPSG